MAALSAGFVLKKDCPEGIHQWSSASARGEAAVGLECLALQVAAPVAGLASQHGRRVGEQCFGRLACVRALEDLSEQSGCESELVAFSRKRERVQFTERQQAGQIVAAVERAKPFDGAAALVAGRRGLVRDFRGSELVPQALGSSRVGLDQIRRLEPAGRAGRRVAGQLEGERLARQRVAVRVDRLDGVGDAVFGVGEQWRGLLGLIACLQPRKTGVGHQLDVPLFVDDANPCTAPVADDGLLEHVAVVIDLQRQRVLDARIRLVALVVIADRLAGMSEVVPAVGWSRRWVNEKKPLALKGSFLTQFGSRRMVNSMTQWCLRGGKVFDPNDETMSAKVS